MGDVICQFPVRSIGGETPQTLRLYFDSGSPFTFIRKSATSRFKAILPLPRPVGFEGLGDGRFSARALLHMEVRLLDFWCRHTAYVVADDVLAADYDVLVGHDFMQKFNVGLAPKRQDVVLNPASLRLAQTIRRAAAG